MSAHEKDVPEFTLNPCSCFGAREGNFEDVLKRAWASRCHLLRYSPEGVITKLINGTYEFTAERNPARKTTARPLRPSGIYEVMSQEEFNFNKIDQEEIMIRLSTPSCNTHSSFSSEQTSTYIVINLSPFGSYSSLLVPNITHFNCQFPTPWGLKQAMLCLFASSDPQLKIGFNSLCGHASVNHEHYHIFFTRLSYIQRAELKLVHSSVYEVEGYPAKGFVFPLRSLDQCDEVVSKVMILINFMKESDIAFNISLVKTCSGNSLVPTGEARLFVWPRNPARGSKSDYNFVVAAVELSGHFIITDPKLFDDISEEFVAQQMNAVTSRPWGHVKERILDLLQ